MSKILKNTCTIVLKESEDVMEVDGVVSSKKRLPSGSPEGKQWDQSGDGEEEEDTELENSYFCCCQNNCIVIFNTT